MRRFLRIAATPLLLLGLMGCATALAPTAVAATSAPAAACSGQIDVTQIAFTPATVSPGQSASLSVTVANCTDASISATAAFYSVWQPSGAAVPSGCFVFDPIAQPVTLAAGATSTQSLGFTVPASCTATGLQVTVEFTDADGVLGEASAVLGVTQGTPPYACRVVYTETSVWTGGFTASIAITNTGTNTFSGWRLTFTFGGDQVIISPWGGEVTQVGKDVTITNVAYNANLAPGATISIGFEGTWTTSDAAPTNFALNGVPCSS